MKRPFLGIGISSIIGIVISYYLQIDMIISFVFLIIVFLGFIFAVYKDRANTLFILALSMVISMTGTSYKLSTSTLMKTTETPLNVVGIVDKVVSEGENQSKYILKVALAGVSEKTMLKIIGDSNLELGDQIKFSGIFKIPMTNTNPKLYNYRENLISKDIYTSVNIKKDEIIEVDKNSRNIKYKIRSAFRLRVESTFNKYLDNKNSDLMKGIILGDYSYLDEDYLKAYREIGLAHILAVSGLHIGIIAGAMVFFMSRIGLKRKWNIIITISMIWIYGYLIGFPASILRANIMFSLLFVASLIAEPYDSINALFLSFWILLLFNPLNIFSVGFQLSYVATFSILFFTPKIRELLYRFEKGPKGKNKLVLTISALIGLYLGILPIQIYYFNEFSFMSIVSNILVGPIISFVLILSFTLIIVELLFSPLSILIGFAINLALNIETVLVDIIYKLNFLNFKFGSPNIFQIFIYYIFIFIGLKAINFSRFKANIIKSIYAYLIFVFIFTVGHELTKDSLQIDFIDVGQGDSALVRSRSGDYLIDTGGELFGDFDICQNITLPYLEKHGIKNLKAIFITHFHLDHCKGIPLLVGNLNIENIFISYKNTDSEIYNFIVSSSIPVTLLEAGDRFNIDKNTIIKIISPSNLHRDIAYSENNLSLVFNMSYYDKNILFTGDCEMETERDILDKLNKIDILKVGHHGSSTSSTEDFLNKVRPDIAIISVGRNNSYGHPGEEVLDRFNSLGSHIYRTDTMGMTRVILERENMEVIPFLKESHILEDYYLDLVMLLIYYFVSYICIRNYWILEEELNKVEIQ